MRCLLAFVLIMQIASLPVYAEGEATRTEPLEASIDQLLTNLEKEENSRGINAGIAVYNLTKDEYLYTHNHKRAFVPASNLKLFTAAAALEKLGPDFQYKTEVYTDGKVNKSGILDGNLIVKGYGDPSLSVEDLTAMVQKIKEQGITHINGNLLLDESYFDDVRLGYGWMWDDELYSYSAQLSALAVNENAVTVEVAPGSAVGRAPAVTVVPANSYVQIQNEAITVDGNASDIVFDRPRGQNTIIISGTIGKQAVSVKEDLGLEDPALFVGDVFKHLLEENSITLGKNSRIGKMALQTGSPLLTHYSKPLRELIVHLNKESDNFYAEMLLKTMGALWADAGSSQAGARVVSEFLLETGASGFKQVDGSGLSRFDLITPDDMIKLLRYVEQQEYREIFIASLPIAGVAGTLQSRMKGTPAENNLMAKTGSMSGVSSLSGTVTAGNGDQLLFSILLNGVYKSRYANEFEDNLGVLLAQYPNLPDPGGQEAEDRDYKLSRLIDPILQDARLDGVTTGIVVKSLERGANEAVLYQMDADKLLTPASNLKLLASATALQRLGEEYRYKTEVFLSAPVNNGGILKGDVIVKGFGDPTLHTEDSLQVQDGVSVEQIVKLLQAEGIKQIHGDIVVDDSYFDSNRLGLGWAWDDESYYYNAQISALAINRGTVRLDYKPASVPGRPVTVELLPKTDYVQVINEAVTVDKGVENTFAIERERAKNIIHVKGKLPIDASPDYERITVEEPALYAGTVLKEKLTEAGIRLQKNSEVRAGTVPENSVKIGELESEPLAKIVQYLLKISDNFYAEMLTKTLGAELNAEGSTEAGIEVILDDMAQLGVNTTFDMVDGSGLTRYNQISPNQIVALLEAFTKAAEFEGFYDALPIAGVDGSLKNRMKDTPAAGNARAKTGSLTGVNSLSGYVTTKDGEKLCFSIVMNGNIGSADNLTAIQDQIVAALAAYEE
ncbi:D-alanyl-D-alanine carboxypeptidase/D-alanyl-D-alanine endopeptidase [Brevibacillus massiliensis]|nr:D-alanyl-D-alanine carboxypeptidase/D-alanyl-D-alanine-endopeptidase [Brevibacillus massiliensis]